LQQAISPEDFPLQQAMDAWSCFSVFAASGEAMSCEQQAQAGLVLAVSGAAGVVDCGEAGAAAGCCAASGSQAARAKIWNTVKMRNFMNSPEEFRGDSGGRRHVLRGQKWI
jgi:hypothetical protein